MDLRLIVEMQRRFPTLIVKSLPLFKLGAPLVLPPERLD